MSTKNYYRMSTRKFLFSLIFPFSLLNSHSCLLLSSCIFSLNKIESRERRQNPAVIWALSRAVPAGNNWLSQPSIPGPTSPSFVPRDPKVPFSPWPCRWTGSRRGRQCRTGWRNPCRPPGKWTTARSRICCETLLAGWRWVWLLYSLSPLTHLRW